MTSPWSWEGDRLVLGLAPEEAALVSEMIRVLDTGDDAAGRLDYSAHPDDPDADERYRQLVEGELDGLRRSDRSRIDAVLAGDPVPAEDVEAFMRVIGEVRLVLAARAGIEEDGWEERRDAASDPGVAIIGWLGYLQDAAVECLSETFG